MKIPILLILGLFLLLSMFGVGMYAHSIEIISMEKTTCYDRYSSEILDVDCEREVRSYGTNSKITEDFLDAINNFKYLFLGLGILYLFVLSLVIIVGE